MAGRTIQPRRLRQRIFSFPAPRVTGCGPALLLAVLGLLFPGAAAAQTYVAGQTYFGADQYVEYRAGDLPVVITAPHGGSLAPGSIPDRVPLPGQDVSTVGDTNVIDLVRRIAGVIFERTGRHAHLVVCHLARRKLDANRDLAVAAQGDAAAGAAWAEYHGFIAAACRAAQAAHGFSFLVDQHGHGHPVARLELGYNLGNATLALSDTELARPRYQWDTYLRTLPFFDGSSLPALLRGPRSLGEFFAARGFPACPSPRDPAPNDPGFFSGGYTTDTHTGLRDNGPGHGVQIEANFAGVRDTAGNRQTFAIAVAEALHQFLFDRYGFLLGTGPLFRLSPPADELRLGGPPVLLTITREGYRATAETLTLSYAGSARRDLDYAAPASVSFLPGQSSAQLVIAPAAGAASGGDKTIEITLAPTSLQAAVAVPLVLPLGDGRSTVVRISAPADQVSEGAGPVVFRLTRPATTAPLSVNLAWTGEAAAGRDYVLPPDLATRATFAAGQRELLLVLPLIDDATLRPVRRVGLEVRPGAGYVPGAPATAFVQIVDNDPAPGLALWLPGPAPDGSLRDGSGAGRHAAFQPGGTTPAVVDAPNGGGLSFNGLDQTVQVPRFTLDPDRAFTLTFFFRLTAGAAVANQNLVSYGARGAAGTLHVLLASPTILRTNLRDTTGQPADTALDATGNWTDGGWRHYALVVDAQEGRRLFLGGFPVRAAAGWAGPLNAEEQLWLGWRPQNAAAGHLSGALADFRVYRRALTAAEIAALAAPQGSDSAPARIANLSIRSNAGQGDATLIVGFFVRGAVSGAPSALLVRGIGPGLATFGISGALADPEIELVRDGTRIAANDNWGGSAGLSASFAAAGAFPLAAPDSRDAALLLPSLAAGGYSVLVRGTSGSTGIALAEIYDVSTTSTDASAPPRLVNVSARAQVGTGDAILIAGFGVSGGRAQRVLIRAVGPTLATFGVARPLANPELALFRESALVARNDDWSDDVVLRAAAARVGAFALPPASADAGLVLTLGPGTYTAQVSGTGGSTGIALVEVYEVP